MVLHGPVLYPMVLYGPVCSFMVLNEISDNHASQYEITHNGLRKLEKNKKSLNSTMYHDIAKYDTRYLMLDSMLYQKITIDSSFSNELYPCAPIVRLITFYLYIMFFDTELSSILVLLNIFFRLFYKHLF